MVNILEYTVFLTFIPFFGLIYRYCEVSTLNALELNEESFTVACNEQKKEDEKAECNENVRKMISSLIFV